jgi:hypothetical protein
MYSKNEKELPEMTKEKVKMPRSTRRFQSQEILKDSLPPPCANRERKGQLPTNF